MTSLGKSLGRGCVSVARAGSDSNDSNDTNDRATDSGEFVDDRNDRGVAHLVMCVLRV